MKLRQKSDGTICSSSNFNVNAMSEILVYWKEEMDTCFIKDFDVFIEANKKWMDLSEAFKQHDVIIDNYNTCFFEPQTIEDRKRGFAL